MKQSDYEFRPEISTSDYNDSLHKIGASAPAVKMMEQPMSSRSEEQLTPYNEEQRAKARVEESFRRVLDLPSGINYSDLQVALTDYQHSWMRGRKRVME